MSKTSDYWKERFKQVEESQHQQGLECYEDIENQYRRAQKDIEGKLSVWYQRFAKNNGISLTEAKKLLTSDELEEFKWDVKDYIKHGQENAKTGQWLKQLENASAKYHISRLEALKIQTQQSIETLFGNQLDSIDSAMRDVYTSGYYKTAYEIQKGVGVGWEFAKLDDRTISKVINKPWAADGKNFSARVWSNREKLVNELNKTLTQNIILGQDPQKAINEIARKMNTSKQAAGRLVMTEEAFFSSAAQKDCFKELDVEQYEIVATLDSRTSEICQDMDGKRFSMSEWEIGVTAPPFHVNCRTTTVPYDPDFDEFDPGQRAARGADGKVYYVPADMTYKEWEKKFVDGGDKSELEEVKKITPQETAANEQTELLLRYGNLTNLMFKGTSEDMLKWSELQKISSKSEKDILTEISKNADNWETMLSNQTEDTMKPFINQLLEVATDEELVDLRYWTGSAYVDINRYLRYGVNVSESSKNAAKNIENVLNKLETPEEIIVRRGTGTKHIFEKMTGDWESDPSVLVGQEFSDKGFTATSSFEKGGFSGVGKGNAELFIRVPKGTHGAYIELQAHNEQEKEFLLQKGYSYRIIKAEYRANGRKQFADEKDLKVWCEVILNE